ncbi:MAG TPA: glycosyltransferase family 39 protein, partial [Geothermobacteraceae bacterium]|nr:glycosyltransferase family 39 protein [Geothermobacteraceae bacterium]
MNQLPNATAVDERLWTRRLLILLALVSCWRLIYLYLVPLDLGPDEAYYWDWSRQLAWGYFSKPPLIAWVNALSTGLLGISAEVVRLPAVVLGAAGLYGLFLAARRLFDARVGFWAVAAWLATMGAASLGLIMATDVLLCLFWGCGLYFLWRLLEAPQQGNRWWWGTLCCVGFGALGKQMMLVFLLLMFIYLLCSREDRPQLRRAWPYTLSLFSCAFLLPTLYWNDRHDWITLQHTAHHVELSTPSLLERLGDFAEFVGSQLGLLSPITWLLLVATLLIYLRGFRTLARQDKYLLAFSAPGLLVFFGLSFFQSINPNWPAVFYLAGMILLAARLAGGARPRPEKWFLRGIALGVVLTLIAYSLPLLIDYAGLPLGKLDPSKRIRGWSGYGEKLAQTLEQQPRPDRTIIISPLRKYVAEAAFYVPGHPVAYRWSGPTVNVASQYELWPGPYDKSGWDALIVTN